MRAETRLELQRLLAALCDGQLSEAQQTRLDELLRADPACRRLYLEYIDMHARLLMHPGLAASPVSSPPADKKRPGRGGRKVRQALKYVLVAAGTLAASLLVQVLLFPPRPPDIGQLGEPAPIRAPAPQYVATLAQTSDCVWGDPGEPRRVGARLLPGELRLQKGLARVRFDNGPELVVEGPAVLRLDSGTAATVLRGKVFFKADETAAPFELHTPSSTLVDLGTQYAVMVGPEGEEVHVFDGEVQRTSRTASSGAEPEHLTAGEARRYAGAPDSLGQPTALDPARFVRQLSNAGQPPLDPAAGLLAYEGFDYKDPEHLHQRKANGGIGWASPWTPGFARPRNEGDQNLLALNVKEGLVRAGAAVPAVGGSFDYTGFAKYFRQLAAPVRLDTDGVYYLSFLFRRHGPPAPADEVNAVAVLLWTTEDFQQKTQDPRKRLNVGVGGSNQLFTHLQGVSSRTPLPLSYGETYLLVAKIVASDADPDQVFMRVYGPEEPIDPEESGSWSVVGLPFRSDLVFDWLQLHINSQKRQTIDEVRLGSTWSSVTAPWISVPGAGKEGNP